LLDSYVRQCTTQCPMSISELFSEDLNMQKLSNVMYAMIQWRHSCWNEISYENFHQASFDLQRLIFVTLSPDKNRLYNYVIEQLNDIDTRLLTLFFGACFLKIASNLDRGHSCSQLLDPILTLIQSHGLSSSLNDATLLGRPEVGNNKRISVALSNNMRTFTICKCYETACLIMHAARLAFNTAMSLSIGLLLTELSKFYLQSALKCNGTECRDLYARSRNLLNVYLACLCCSAKSGSSAISIFHKLCHSDRQLLACFDESVETLLGLIVFHHFIRQTLTDCRHQNMQVDVLTADLLACYLKVLYSVVHCAHLSRRLKSEIFEKYQTGLLNKKELTIGDVLLFHETSRRANFFCAHKTQLNSISQTCLRCDRRVQSASFQTSRLSQFLVEIAVENLTAFRLTMSRDFSSVRHIDTSDFQAMYAYKSGSYEQCLSLCEKNIVCLLLQEVVIDVLRVKESDLLHLMDDESLSLIGLAKLCGVFDINTQETEALSQLTLSVYLLVQCKLRLKHSPATFIEVLHLVTTTYYRHRSDSSIINRTLMMLAYRRVIQHLR
jgi:hypothetical protein